MVNRRQKNFFFLFYGLNKTSLERTCLHVLQCLDKGVDIYLKEEPDLLNIT